MRTAATMLCACPCRVHRPLLQPHPQSPAPPPPARSGTSIAPTPPAITQPLPVARHDSPAGRAVSVRAGSRLIAGPFFASSSAQARPARRQSSGAGMERLALAAAAPLPRRRCAAPASSLRHSCAVVAPLLHCRCACPQTRGPWACVCGCRVAERQRGRGKRQRHREPPGEMQSARARNAIGQAVSVLTSHYCCSRGRGLKSRRTCMPTRCCR